MKLSVPIEGVGHFWLPEKPGEKPEGRVTGTLKISESQNITLEVMPQSFPKANPRTLNDPLFPGQELHFKRIHGITTFGRVVMEDCYVTKTSIGRGITTSRCRVNCILIAKIYNTDEDISFYDKDEDISFSRVRCSMEGLNEWLSISGFEHGASRSDHSDDRAIRYSLPKEITIPLPDENMELEFGFAVSSETEFTITQDAHATLKSKTVRSFDDFQLAIRKLRRFLNFATGKEVKLTSMVGYHENIVRKVVQKTGESGQDIPIPIHVYYQVIQPAESNRKVYPTHMVFSYKEMKNKIESMMLNWFKSYRELQPAFSLYFAFRESKSAYIESQFLFLMHGVEALHRKSFQKQNRHLKQRLTEIIGPFQHLYEEEGPCDEEERRCEKIVTNSVDARNTLVHLNNEAEIDYPELMALTSNLDALFQLHFLKLCGVDKSTIDELAKEPVLDRKIKDSPDNYHSLSFLGG